jgi:hypothetical protein
MIDSENLMSNVHNENDLLMEKKSQEIIKYSSPSSASSLSTKRSKKSVFNMTSDEMNDENISQSDSFCENDADDSFEFKKNSDLQQNRKESTSKCKSSGYNIKDIYNNLLDIDEKLNKELINDYFCSDNYQLEPNLTQQPSATLTSTLANNKLVIMWNNQKKGTRNNSNNRSIEFNDWNDGLCEWQLTHPYPTLKNYITSLNKRKSNKLEFDHEIGFYLPNKKETTNIKKENNNSTSANQQNMENHSTNQSDQSNLNVPNKAHLNSLNNEYASTRLLNELQKLVKNSSKLNEIKYINTTEAESSTNGTKHNVKKDNDVKETTSPTQNIYKNHENLSNLIHSHLQLRSDELDRFITINNNISHTNTKTNGKSKLNEVNIFNQNKLNSSIETNSSSELNVELESGLVNTILKNKKNILKPLNTSFEFNESSNVASMNSNNNNLDIQVNSYINKNAKAFKLNTAQSNNNSHSSLSSLSNSNIKNLNNNSNLDGFLSSSNQYEPTSNNNSSASNKLLQKQNQNKTNLKSTPSTASVTSNNSNQNNLVKQYSLNGLSTYTQRLNPLSENNKSQLSSNSSAPLMTTTNFDMITTTSLPPIISGKRINLPLGPHRYL